MAEVSFGEWLKRRRAAEGWTQKQLAQQINCSISTLRKMEAEQRRPSVPVVERLAQIFSIPTNEFKSFRRFSRGDWQAFSSHDGKSEDSLWHVSSTAPLSNLPVSVTSFIGREGEQDEIISLLRKNRLVTLAGVGGIGKTRLALQVAQGLQKYYPNGVWFVALDSLSEPTLIPQTVASVFDIREGSSGRPLLERLTSSLRNKNTLLFLDNCEHLLHGCEQLIEALLTNCPHVKVLVTSREVLHLKGEAIYYVPSLSTPVDNTSIELLTNYESIRLFSERASLARSSFKLTKENAKAITDICRRVDGVPLAIELAAAHVNILQVEEILKQLEDSFSLLSSDRRITSQRHRTLQASMDWSWRLLREEEQIFLQQLSVFEGGWTLEASQAVCDGDVLNLTGALVKKSLIVVNQASDNDTRYCFHEIVRQYAYEKLDESGETADFRTRHLHYFSNLSEQAEPALRGPTQVEWMSHLKDERDNIRATLEWADKTDLEAGLYISGRLRHFWESFDLREGSYWLSKFLQKPESHVYLRARAKALYMPGLILESLQKFDVTLSAATECLELYRAVGDQQGEIDGLLLLGSIVDFPQRVDFTQQALALARSLGDIWRQAWALSNLGATQVWSLSYVGAINDEVEPLAYWEQAITLFRQSGDWRSLAELLTHIANYLLLNGEFELAQKHLDQATLLNNQLNDKVVKSLLLYAYGRIAMIRREYKQARKIFQEELEITEDLGIRMTSLWCRTQFGYLALREGDLGQARDIFEETAHSFQKDHEVIGVVFSLEGISEMDVIIEQPFTAARLIGWADAARKENRDLRPMMEQADVDKIIAACVEKMGEVAFSDAYDDGQKMTLAEAVVYALREI